MEDLVEKYRTSEKENKKFEFLNNLDILQLLILKHKLGYIKVGNNYDKQLSLDEQLDKATIENNIKSRLRK